VAEHDSPRPATASQPMVGESQRRRGRRPSPRSSKQTASLDEIGREECIRLLRGETVGRVAFCSEGHPVVLPVNFVVLNESVIFRTGPGAKLEAAVLGGPIAFEVDAIDRWYHEGFSVLVVGRCREVTDPPELEFLKHAPLVPWAGAGRDHFVKISLDEVSGRRIRHRDPAASDGTR
jgi:hypothetical protein